LKRYYLGLDGGQSSTSVLISDENGAILGHGRGGPCNHVSGSQGREKFLKVVSDCVREACEGAGLHFPDLEFESVCLGFSGGPADKERYSRRLIRSRRFKITHDAEIALCGATGGEPGIIVIAGTGSMAFGRNASGKFARAGGWGYVFGDEGGGFDIARRGLRAALRMEEGWGPATSIRERFLELSGAPDANSMMHRFYTTEFSRPKFAAFSLVLAEAAASGDRIAKEVLREAARDLVTYVEGVYHNLFSSREPPKIAFVGGVFRNPDVRTAFVELVSERMGVQPQAPLLGPAAGALLDALRADGNRSHLHNVPESEK
jgi:N-acetylglucosamine kinase-like BadF-type ATPase